MNDVLRHVVESISPASAAHAEGARQNVAAAGAPVLERLATVLGGAQHTPRPRGARRTIVVCAGDHGIGDPGVALGEAHPTVVAARAIADGTAALAQVARASQTRILLVAAGTTERMPDTAVQLGRAAPTRDLIREPAMTVVDASLALEAGIALSVSLADDGIDVVALGAIGVGSDVASAALLGASTGVRVTAPLEDAARAARGGVARASSAGDFTDDFDDATAELAWAKGVEMAGSSGIEKLAAFGGPETGVLAGLMLGLASINVPVILDSYATGSAALVATAIAPAVRGYFIAAHVGTFTHRRILRHLALEPIFEVGLGHGEGTGAAMAIPLVDQVAALVHRG